MSVTMDGLFNAAEDQEKGIASRKVISSPVLGLKLVARIIVLLLLLQGMPIQSQIEENYMTKRTMLVFLFLLLVSSAQFGQTSRAGKTPSTRGKGGSKKSMIGFVQRNHIAEELGCTYFSKSDPTRVVYSDDFAGNIWLNIDGQDVKVELVSSLSSPRGQVRKGQRTVSSYVALGIKVSIDTVVTRAEYEGSEYAGILTVIKGSRRQKLKVIGSCNGG